MSKSLAPKERAWITDQENGMICYTLMKTSRVMKDLKLAKLEKSAESATICSFQLKISWKLFIEIYIPYLFSWSVFQALSFGLSDLDISGTLKIVIFLYTGFDRGIFTRMLITFFPQ